jgi:hypothetical protein
MGGEVRISFLTPFFCYRLKKTRGLLMVVKQNYRSIGSNTHGRLMISVPRMSLTLISL